MSTLALARHLVNTKFVNLSEDAINAAKRSILDTLGVIFPASTLDKNCSILYELMREAGGKQESTLIGFGDKMPCRTAAFINGALAHAIDYDDCAGDDNPLVHPTASTLPAALAIAERAGGVSGRDFISAIALGNDCSIRLASCPRGIVFKNYPFFPITTFGIFGATAASGKLLDLSEAQMINALGLALNRVSGITQAIGGTDFRGIRDSFTNEAGVMAALMAEKGISACNNALERLFEIYYKGDYTFKPLTSDLGKYFRGVEAGYKPWPSCGWTHSYIQSTLQAINENKIQSEDISEIILTGNKSGEAYCLPHDIKRNPESSINAKASIPFVVGVAAVHRNVALAHFLPESLKDSRVLDMAEKVKYKVDGSFGNFTSQTDIITRGKHTYSSRVDKLRGSTLNPMSTEELVLKFKDCAGYSRKLLSIDEIETIISKILNLENVDDISEITDILV